MLCQAGDWSGVRQKYKQGVCDESCFNRGVTEGTTIDDQSIVWFSARDVRVGEAWLGDAFVDVSKGAGIKNFDGVFLVN